MLEKVVNSLAEADTVVKQECKEEDSIDIVDELQQLIKSEQESVQDNYHSHENYVDVLEDVESTTINIKQECEEGDPLHSPEDLMKGLQSEAKELKESKPKSVHENVRYNCDKCDKSFSKKSHFNRHMKSIHENVKHICDKCEKTFSLKHNLMQHIQSVHDNLIYDCDKCDKSFSRRNSLRRHAPTIHAKFRYNCNKCDKRFPSQ